MISHIWLIVAWPLHLELPSGCTDGFPRVPWTCPPSGTLAGLKPHLLEQAVLHFPSLCLCLLWLSWCGWSIFQWSLRQKSQWVSQCSCAKYTGLLFLSGEVSQFPLFFFYHQYTYRSFSCCLWHLWADFILPELCSENFSAFLQHSWWKEMFNHNRTIRRLFPEVFLLSEALLLCSALHESIFSIQTWKSSFIFLSFP